MTSTESVARLSSRDRHLLVARCLEYAPERESLRARLAAPDLPWPDLLSFVHQELLAPTLWVRLREKGLTDALPPEVAGTLRRGHAVNAARNARIRQELVEVVGALNAVGVEPVILKGAVDLVIPRYADSGTRILRDIDLFVPREELVSAVRGLEAIGFVEAPREETKFVTYYADLNRDGNLVGIDLQFFISGQRDLLTPEEVSASSVRHQVDGVSLLVPSPEHQVIHNLFHSEVQDRGGDVGFLWLRQLFDLVALWQLHRDELDWVAVQKHFASRGFRRLVPKRLFLAQRLLHVPMPAVIAPTTAARLHYHRCLLQLRWGWLERASALRATLTSAVDPRMVDVMYDAGPRGWRNNLNRILHGVRLWGRHRGGVRGIIAKRLAKFD